MRRTPVVMPALTALALLTTACATTPRQSIDGTRQVRATVETTPVATATMRPTTRRSGATLPTRRAR